MRHLIYLLRHAKSSWGEPELLDHDRPLAKRGQKAVALLREHFRESGVVPDLVLCSSAVRATQTLEGVRKGLPPGARVEIEAGIYAADAASLLQRLRRVPEEVGSVDGRRHNRGSRSSPPARGGGNSDAARRWRRSFDRSPRDPRLQGEWRELGPRRDTGRVTCRGARVEPRVTGVEYPHHVDTTARIPRRKGGGRCGYPCCWPSTRMGRRSR